MSTIQTAPVGGHRKGLAATQRTDRWWVGPLLTFLGLSAFVVYSTVSAFYPKHYYSDPYLSPFFAPSMFIDSSAPGSAPADHAWFGEFPDWWPGFLPASPAFFILVLPLSFRFTCYYYRKAYYRSFVATPPGCAVGPIPQKPYKGETGLLVLQNIHRYTLYFAIAVIYFLLYHAIAAFFKDGKFGVGVGSIVLIVNAILIALYTFGCHAWRHLVGGRRDCFSCSGAGRLQHKAWERCSWLNARHMLFAWVSLFWVGFTDLYVRLVAMGAIRDFNTWGS